MAHSNLGNALFRKGQVDATMAHYQKARGIYPDYAKAHSNARSRFPLHQITIICQRILQSGFFVS
jgi:hypothetical protein